MRKIIITVIVVVFFTVSCSRKTVPVTSDPVISEEKISPVAATINYQKEGYIPGTIIDMTGLDGCSFMIKLENGKKLEPDHLEDHFKQNDLPVWIKYSIPKSTFGICMSGQMVILTAIQKR